MMIYTGVRLSKQNVERAQCLAQQLGVSRNRLLELLIANARIESKPVINVSLKNEKSSVSTYQGVDTAFSESL